ncbi:MAG: carboxypeptidase-like regulatory domain-containing protein [Acidobacteriota bacterium]|nr:carboxypeptidase-like regulatory domain-containing protein [Acidobacteriota bacterium]
MENNRKNTIAIFNSYLPGKTASRKTIVSNDCGITQNSFKLKTSCFASFTNAVLLMLLSFFLMMGQAKAASYTVNLNTDAPDIHEGNGICDSDAVTPGNQCTLRAALQEANYLVGVDNITFSLPTPNTINLVNGGLEIQFSVSIEGPGARALTIQRGAGPKKLRVFAVLGSNVNVNISGVTIANGNSEDDLLNGGLGGGIYLSGATLNLTEVNISNNAAQNNGGGIYNLVGTLNVTRSTIRNNQAGNSGGGIYNSGGTVNITNSTVSNNNAGGEVSDYGGGVYNANNGNFNTIGAVVLTNVTVSGNTAHTAGGIRNNSSTIFNVRNTIVAGNMDGSSYPDVLGTFNSQGNNLIGVANPSSGFTDGVKGDKTGFLGAPLDAKLGSLQNNGGQTDTHSLLLGSPAIDAGNDCVALNVGCLNVSLFTDQRGTGFPRRVDGDNNGTATVDIGAFEAMFIPTAASVTVGGRVKTANGRGIRNVIITIAFPTGERRSVVSSAFGYYRFADIPAGETYILSVAAKRYSFSQPTQIRNLVGETEDIDFVADAPGLFLTENSTKEF